MSDIVERLREWQADPKFSEDFAGDVGYAADEIGRLRDLLRDIEAAAKPPGTDIAWCDTPWSGLYDRLWDVVHGTGGAAANV